MRIFAVFAFVALGSIGQASQIFVNCSSFGASGQSPIANGSGSSACAGLATPLGNINFAQLLYKYDGSFGFGAGTINMAHDVLGTDLNAFDLVGTQQITETIRPFNGSITVNAPSAAVLAAIAAGSTIQSNWSGATGAATNVAFDYRWVIDYDVQSTTPEPSTYAMMTAGLVGLFLSRRKS